MLGEQFRTEVTNT